jgi:hypothetical protein
MRGQEEQHTSLAPPPKNATLSACTRSRVCTFRKAPSKKYSRFARAPKSGVTTLPTPTTAHGPQMRGAPSPQQNVSFQRNAPSRIERP